MPRPVFMFSVLMMFVVVTCGCSSMNVQRPTVSIANVGLGAIGEEGFTLNFDLDAANPNAFDLPIGKSDYRLGIAGATVIKGNVEPAGTLPANGTGRVRVPVEINYARLREASDALVRSGGNISYAFDAGLVFGDGTAFLGRSVKVPLSYKGDLPLKDLLSNPTALRQLGNFRKLENLLDLLN